MTHTALQALLSGLSEQVDALHEAIDQLELPETPPFAETAPPNPFRVFRYFYEGVRLQSYSSWFPCWGGIIGAAHSDESFGADVPPFAVGRPEVHRPGAMDAVLYGCVKPARPPRQLQENDRIRLYGFPAGSEHLSVRTGYIQMERPGGGSWIVVFDDGQELAVGGMSGGAATVVLPNGDEVLSGIIITQNSRADVDFDGYAENGADIVSLRDIWEVLE